MNVVHSSLVMDTELEHANAAYRRLMKMVWPVIRRYSHVDNKTGMEECYFDFPFVWKKQVEVNVQMPCLDCSWIYCLSVAWKIWTRLFHRNKTSVVFDHAWWFLEKNDLTAFELLQKLAVKLVWKIFCLRTWTRLFMPLWWVIFKMMF